MNVRNLLVVALGLVGMATLATSASASDPKTFPGVMCEPMTASQPFQKLHTGMIQNPATNNRFFVCPIVRDNPFARSNGGIVSALVQVKDLQPGSLNADDVICELWSQKSNGTQGAFLTRRTTGFNSAMQTLSYGSLPSFDTGAYNLHCNVPGTHALGSSGIALYYINEAD